MLKKFMQWTLAASLTVAGLGLVNQAVAHEGPALDKAPVRTNDMASLQRGAKTFVNYCLNCHSAAFNRYVALTELGLTEQQIKDNLMFTTDKLGDTMKAAIDPRQAKEWFGANPPDLTLIARSRASESGTGADYLYTYMRTFYRDDSRPTGWNNLAFPNVGMPHVLWELQGERRPVYQKEEAHGHEVEVFKGWEQLTPGTQTPEQYDQTVADLVNYLQWMGEPNQDHRVRLGVWVLIFLLGFSIIAWRLNAAFWKDIK